MSLLRRISGKIDRTIRAVHYLAGSENLIYAGRENSDLILMYHNVLPGPLRTIHVRQISTENFRNQLLFLKKKYLFVSLKDIFVPSKHQYRLAVTFDDGLINTLKFALPVLEELGIPATVFVTTIHLRNQDVLWPDALDSLLYKRSEPVDIGSDRFVKRKNGMFVHVDTGVRLTHFIKPWTFREKWDFLDKLSEGMEPKPWQEISTENSWRMMNAPELKKLSESPLIEIGSHGITHSNFAFMEDSEVRQEMLDSKLFLEKVTGKQIDSIAFPDGSYNPRTLDLAEEVGYKYQLAVSFVHPADEKDNRVRSRLGLYSDLSQVEQLHQINLHLKGPRK